jgi:regulator of sigma D
MPHRNGDPRQQFVAVDEMLQGWLRERRQLLARYTELAVAADSNPDAHDLAKRQSRLCQVLVDYVSAGHFEIFHGLIAEAESFADGSASAAATVMPAIGDTTEVIMAYEEKYAGNGTDRTHLERDLSSLGEVLESRFSLEDQLITALHYSHRAQALPNG